MFGKSDKKITAHEKMCGWFRQFRNYPLKPSQDSKLSWKLKSKICPMLPTLSWAQLSFHIWTETFRTEVLSVSTEISVDLVITDFLLLYFVYLILVSLMMVSWEQGNVNISPATFKLILFLPNFKLLSQINFKTFILVLENLFWK